MTYTDTQKYEAALREVKKREVVYPRLITTGSMTSSKAVYEIEIMRAIAADYEALAAKERLL